MASLSPLPDMTCILSCRIPLARATKINRLSIYMYNPRVDMRPGVESHSFGIRKGILHTWLRSHLAGLRAWVAIDAASRPIVARSWILDGSLLYVYIVGGGPCKNCMCASSSDPSVQEWNLIAWACYNLSMCSLEASCLKKCVKWFRWASGQKKEERKTNAT